MLFGTQTINEQGHLEVGGCDTVELARVHGTPLYVMDEEALRQRCIEYREAFEAQADKPIVAFASKAFLCKAMVRLASEAGLHLDVASLGELRLVAEAGVPLDKVTLHGNFKKDEDLEAALELGIGLVAIDSIDEYRRLSELAVTRGVRQRSILRVSPGIDAHTLDAISTGRNDTKFGITVETGAALEALEECLSLPGIELIGIHSHIGSQILELEPFQLLAARLMDFLLSAREKPGWSAELVVLGGGLGIQYEETDDPPALQSLAGAIIDGIAREADERGLETPRIGIEPGRSIVGELGLTLYEIGPIKTVPSADGGTRTYVSVDGGLSDNPRPVMYDAPYPVLLANRAGEDASMEVRIAGRHCETDTLIPAAFLPEPKSGDLLAVQCTGAYNHTMASNYNFFYRPAVVFAKQGKAREVVRRETQEDLLARDLD
ncbi:MAG: diaminopimelate decarboxylase [Planctomycetes bacterium]|nr:diaminopimelate decarboxylase [Planctomycetota bacterium]